MKLPTCAVVFLCLIVSKSGFSQYTYEANDKYSHHVGLQVNPLLKQIINFGNTPNIENPFLMKYALRNNAKHLEFIFGAGYAYSNQEEEEGLNSDLFQLDFRGGIAKKISLGKKLEVGFGLDLVFQGLNTKTINIQSFNGGGGFVDSTISTTKSVVYQFGGGPQFTLDYYITNNIKIGTEATFYYLTGKDTFELIIQRFSTDFQTGGLQESTSNEKDTLNQSSFNIQVPVALFLTIIF